MKKAAHSIDLNNNTSGKDDFFDLSDIKWAINANKCQQKENISSRGLASVQKESLKYGELIVLGYNGCIGQAALKQEGSSKVINSSRRKSKFILNARDKPNGVKPSAQFSCHNKQDFENLISKNENNHSVTYTLSRNHQVIVQYASDEKTDMFQIGRSTEAAIDFIVLDTQGSLLTSKANERSELSPKAPSQSTISRYSCRILVERNYPYTAKIYAAGFDSTKRIFLGEKASKWKNDKGDLDGLTTNGVLIMHPANGFEVCRDEDHKYSNEWFEVSVCGTLISLNESRLTPCINTKKNKYIASSPDPSHPFADKKTNILMDGTLIDLCGATLLWRSSSSLRNTPTKQYLEMNLAHLNRLKPQCPVGFKTLVFPSSASPAAATQGASMFLAKNVYNENSTDRKPMVYLKCGHVHGQHDWGVKKDNERECPLCRKVGPYVQLLMGLEPSFYCDIDLNSFIGTNPFKPYAFLPCGHMASETTCRYWSQIMVPHGITQVQSSLCPFCAVPLCKEQPFVKLILQESLE